ncbi:MAG: PEFG-CTERM domain-containing protein, partial [Nitrosopumilaceae archaeon]
MSVSSFGEGVIDIFSLNTEVTSTESVLVTGFVSTESFYKPVKLEVYDPNGDLVYSPKINFNEDGHFSW